MKKIIGTILITVLLCGMAGIAYAQTWQETLEKHFDIVSTFDDLQDWMPEWGNPSNLPKKLDGSPSIWLTYRLEKMSEAVLAAKKFLGPWIGNHGPKYIWNGSKSLRMSFGNFAGSSDNQYGPDGIEGYFGNGNNTSGKSEIHVFYMLKFHHDRIDLSSPPYSWKSSGVNNEYYLQKNGGDPGLKMPNNLIINGIWIDDPIPVFDLLTGLGLMGDAAYDTRDDKIGNLENNQWAYGDKNNLGYETIYIKLAEGVASNEKGENYIQYENGFFTQKNENEFHGAGVIKHFRVGTGFISVREWRDIGGDDGCVIQDKEVYGCDFQIWNIGSDNKYLKTNEGDVLFFKDQVNVSKRPETCWTYEHVINDRYYLLPPYNSSPSDSACTVDSAYRKEQWMGVEYKVKVGTADTADGSSELWLYDPDGNEMGHIAYGPEMHLRNFPNFKYNKFAIGGNRIGWIYEYEHCDSWENRYYIDDFIINGSRIGPTYFALVKNQPVIITSSLFEAIVNQSYSHIVQATGGMTPYTWQITAGSLPQDLTLNENTGEISGAPVNEGLWTFTIEVTDAEFKTASMELSLTVTATGITGDINGDGIVNVLDVQACVNHILGWASYDKADVNGDGSVDVVDVQAVVNVILNSV